MSNKRSYHSGGTYKMINTHLRWRDGNAVGARRRNSAFIILPSVFIFPTIFTIKVKKIHAKINAFAWIF